MHDDVRTGSYVFTLIMWVLGLLGAKRLAQDGIVAVRALAAAIREHTAALREGREPPPQSKRTPKA